MDVENEILRLLSTSEGEEKVVGRVIRGDKRATRQGLKFVNST